MDGKKRQFTGKKYILPQVYTYNDDLSKKWFVHYSFYDASRGEMIRYRYSKGINLQKTVEGRKQHMRNICKKIKKKILSGWNPIDEAERVSYLNLLEYRGKDNKVEGRQKTIDYHLNHFLKGISCRPATYTSYKSKFRYFLKYVKSKKRGNIFIYQLTRDDADGFVQYLKNERKLTNKTINDYVVLMKRFFGNAVRSGYCQENVFEHHKKLKESTKRPRTFSSDITKKIVKVMEENDTQMYLAIQMMFNCFIRPGELRKLRIWDIDFSNGSIRIPADVSKVGKQRVVVIPDHLLAKLKNVIQGRYPEEYYIISKKGEPWIRGVGRNYLYNRFVRIKKMLDIPNSYILYAWKHTGMVELKRSGADWLAVRNQAGHSSLDQTIAYTTELMGDCDSFIKSNAPRI